MIFALVNPEIFSFSRRACGGRMNRPRVLRTTRKQECARSYVAFAGRFERRLEPTAQPVDQCLCTGLCPDHPAEHADRLENLRDAALVEEAIAIGNVLRAQDSPPRCLVVECRTLWLTNLLCVAPDRLESERRSLCDAVTGAASDVILVGNETGLGVVPARELSRRFVDEAGSLHQQLAAICDGVTLTVAGLPLELKSATTVLESCGR